MTSSTSRPASTPAGSIGGLPERIGRYRVARQISRGGMAEVYEAYLDGDGGFSRRFAIKTPLPNTELQHLAAFADEARILSQLHHPGVVGVMDFGTHEGWPYQVLEYVDGADVKQLYGQDAFTDTRALMVTAQAARALHYVHTATDWQGRELGIIHRDVSPQNLLISRAGDLKLIDFGIAMAEGRLAKTQAGTIKGKLVYMAPEQIGGQRVTPRTDVYSLGCVLFFMLRGSSPYATEASRSRAAQRLPPAWRASMPGDLAAIIEKASALHPKLRYSTALEMAEDCERALSTRPDAVSDSLSECWTPRRRPTPARPRRRPARGSDIVVVGVEQPEDAPTLADLGLLSPVRPIASEETAPEPAEAAWLGLSVARAVTEASDSAALVSAPHLSSVGDYAVGEPLAVGDRIYSTTSEAEAPLALKVLECEEVGLDVVGHRLSDAARVSTFDHESFLRVRDFGVRDGRFFIVTERPEGTSLAKLLLDAERSGGLTTSEVLALAASACATVRSLQAQLAQRPHRSPARDLRAATLLLSPEGTLRLMDILIDGPMDETGDPRGEEVRALIALLEMLPNVAGAQAPLQTALGQLRNDVSPLSLSQAMLTLTQARGQRSESPLRQTLAALLLRFSGAEATAFHSDDQDEDEAYAGTDDTLILTQEGPRGPGLEALVTEVDPGEFDGPHSDAFIAARYA